MRDLKFSVHKLGTCFDGTYTKIGTIQRRYRDRGLRNGIMNARAVDSGPLALGDYTGCQVLVKLHGLIT